jgi:Xaa-Pro aminopeptidase
MSTHLPSHPHRLERFDTWMREAQVDCAVVFGADHVTHLCGYSRFFAGPAALVIGRDRSRTLVVMRDEIDAARAGADADLVTGFGERGFGFDLDPVAGLVAATAALPIVAAARRLATASEIPRAEARLAAAVTAATVDASAALARIRLVKDADERARIRAAYELCWKGQAAAAATLAAGPSEIELFSIIQSTAQVAAGRPIEFVCDLLSGPASALVCCPVHVAGQRRVGPGDPVVADVVVRCNGYWGDTAETHVAGVNAEVADVRAELLRILARAAGRLVPGTTGAGLFAEIETEIRAAFPEGEFPHHGGHGLGIGCFEDPHLIPADTRPLEAGMIIAVEPGVYFPGRFGARVENVFVVTEAGGVELRAAAQA